MSELESFDKIFDGNLIASNVEALDALFLDGEKSSSRKPWRRRALPRLQLYVVLVVFHLYNIDTRGLFVRIV
jgi:hypothetical protein